MIVVGVDEVLNVATTAVSLSAGDIAQVQRVVTVV